MDTKPTFGPDDLKTQVVGDIANALSSRPGESQSRQAERTQTATGTIMEFQPGDAIEAMFAGHCVIFHELIVDSVYATLRGEEGTVRRATRGGIVAMDRAFGANLTRLERYRTGQARGQADAQPLDALAETAITDRVLRHRPGTPVPARAAAAETLAPEEAGNLHDRPSATTEARDAVGPARSPRSIEAEQPSEAWLARAAAQLAGLNRQARREFGRHARKRIVPATARPGNAGVTATGNGPATTTFATEAG